MYSGIIRKVLPFQKGLSVRSLLGNKDRWQSRLISLKIDSKYAYQKADISWILQTAISLISVIPKGKAQ